MSELSTATPCFRAEAMRLRNMHNQEEITGEQFLDELEALHARFTSSANVPARTFTICEDHKDADWNQPAMEGVDCILCRLFYLEAQESLLEEWQQRATRAEEAIAEIKRPLDEQMARLNETVTRLNEENERLLAQSATTRTTALEGVVKAAEELVAYIKPARTKHITEVKLEKAIEALHAADSPVTPRFENVFCSQCGKDFGPGDHGYSSCEDHRASTREK